MRWLAILGVLAYRLVLRPFHRRRCLFDESCSAHAIRVLRETGFRRGLRSTRARLQACRMPQSACFVLDTSGRARLLSATGHDGAEVAPGALAWLAHEAERHARAR